MLLIISGPSGVGKTTITRHVEQALGGVFSVSLTTRPCTPNDTPGVDYHFISVEEFTRRRQADELLEWAEVFGHYYGTPRRPAIDALANSKLFILEIDVEGAIQVKTKLPEAFSLFVLPPDEATLLQRLRARGREDDAVIQRRFAKAKAEIARARESGVYDHFLVNDRLDEAVVQAIGLVRDEWTRRRTISKV